MNELYNYYYEQCKDPKETVHQMCRKLDLYWSSRVYDMTANKSTNRTIMSMYLTKLNTSAYAGKSYDDTLNEKGMLWSFEAEKSNVEDTDKVSKGNINTDDSQDDIEIPDDVILFWGSGYTPQMYLQLEERRKYWMSGLPEEMDTGIGAEAIIRQICFLELDINRDRADGKNIDKLPQTLSGLIGSLNLKPSQKKDDTDSSINNTPLGVWIYKFENERPLPKVEDENLIRKTVFTWMGHVCKMLGKKNAYSDLYETEIERLRVERPEFKDEDDEEFMMSVITDYNGGDDE